MNLKIEGIAELLYLVCQKVNKGINLPKSCLRVCHKEIFFDEVIALVTTEKFHVMIFTYHLYINIFILEILFIISV